MPRVRCINRLEISHLKIYRKGCLTAILLVALDTFFIDPEIILFLTFSCYRPETKKPHKLLTYKAFFAYADRTGLEPATSAVTGRHSNQLNYRSINFRTFTHLTSSRFWDGKDKGK